MSGPLRPPAQPAYGGSPKLQHPVTPAWVSTIRHTRRQLRKLQKDHPRFTDDWIRARWDDLLAGAVDEAQTDMGQEIDVPPPLIWNEVFEVEYRVAKRAI